MTQTHSGSQCYCCQNLFHTAARVAGFTAGVCLCANESVCCGCLIHSLFVCCCCCFVIVFVCFCFGVNCNGLYLHSKAGEKKQIKGQVVIIIIIQITYVERML